MTRWVYTFYFIYISTDSLKPQTVFFFFFFTVRQVGYDNELRGAMSYVFGSSIVCDSLDIAKQVQAVSVGSSL